MKKILFLAAFAAFALTSCGSDDDGGGCQTCTVQGATSVEVCQGDNGNAFVAGQDTTVAFSVYIAGLEAAGSTCN